MHIPSARAKNVSLWEEFLCRINLASGTYHLLSAKVFPLGKYPKAVSTMSKI